MEGDDTRACRLRSIRLVLVNLSSRPRASTPYETVALTPTNTVTAFVVIVSQRVALSDFPVAQVVHSVIAVAVDGCNDYA